MLKSCRRQIGRGMDIRNHLCAHGEIRLCFSFLPHEFQTSTFFIGEKRGGKLAVLLWRSLHIDHSDLDYRYKWREVVIRSLGLG